MTESGHLELATDHGIAPNGRVYSNFLSPGQAEPFPPQVGIQLPQLQPQAVEVTGTGVQHLKVRATLL